MPSPIFTDRPGSAMSSSSTETEKEDMWSSMLSSVASSKRMPQKRILVLGGSEEQQKEFVESLGTGAAKVRDRTKPPPVANEFALGYTYLDVLDADHEDVLARLSLYLIQTPTPSFVPLLRPLFTPQTLPETLVVILLDWNSPWSWMRQLKTWVLLLRGIFTSLDDDSRRMLDEVTSAWESRRGTFNADGGAGGAGEEELNLNLPLGPGEFDEPIGVPMCVVCQNSDRIEVLERERGWKEEEFDFVLQFLRTVLLKHGASLIYTTPSSPSPLQPMIHTMLSIASPNTTTSTATSSTSSANSRAHPPLKHNVIERDKVVVPPHWDSWGKIRVLREGFDVEGINRGWSIDVDPANNRSTETPAGHSLPTEPEVEGGALQIYEEVIQDTHNGPIGIDALDLLQNGRTVLEVPPVDTQEFLASQAEALDAKLAEEKQARMGGDMSAQKEREREEERRRRVIEEGAEKVLEHVGPVQFNVGGIQVDAENMLERLKEREASRAGEAAESGVVGGTAGQLAPGTHGQGEQSQNEVLSAFFSSLMGKQGKGGKGKQ